MPTQPTQWIGLEHCKEVKATNRQPTCVLKVYLQPSRTQKERNNGLFTWFLDQFDCMHVMSPSVLRLKLLGYSMAIKDSNVIGCIPGVLVPMWFTPPWRPS